jgi:hypothetical protein
MSNLTPQKIVDKNGKETTVHKNLSKDTAEASKRVAGITPPPAVADIDETPDISDKLAELQKEDRSFNLYYVAYDDGLNDDQIVDFLSGNVDELSEQITDVFSDSAYEYTKEEATAIAKEFGYDYDDLDEEDQEDLLSYVQEHDQSDPVSDLVRNTHSKLLRAPLTANGIEDALADYENSHDTSDFEVENPDGFGGEDFYSTVRFGKNDRASEARVLVLQELLGDRGFDVTSDEAIQNLHELVDNGPYDWHEGVTPEIIWYGDISSANVGEYVDGEKKDERRLDFGNSAHVLLLDRYNGSGHEVEMNGGGINATISTDKPAILDSKSNGYGWDDTAGVYMPAYSKDIDATWT